MNEQKWYMSINGDKLVALLLIVWGASSIGTFVINNAQSGLTHPALFIFNGAYHLLYLLFLIIGVALLRDEAWARRWAITVLYIGAAIQLFFLFFIVFYPIALYCVITFIRCAHRI